ncbi:MAG: hypothetical protein ABIP74_02805 [Candidatus Saccharimonas sp.]
MYWIDNVRFILFVTGLVWLVAPRLADWVNQPSPVGLTIDDLWIADEDEAAKKCFNW